VRNHFAKVDGARIPPFAHQIHNTGDRVKEKLGDIDYFHRAPFADLANST